MGSATGKMVFTCFVASKDLDKTVLRISHQYKLATRSREIVARGNELAETDAAVGMQDMGAAGITCSSVKCLLLANTVLIFGWTKCLCVRKWKHGRYQRARAYAVVVEKGKEQVVLDIFDKWDLECEEIGIVTEGGTVNYYWGEELMGGIPVDSAVLGGTRLYTTENGQSLCTRSTRILILLQLQSQLILKRSLSRWWPCQTLLQRDYHDSTTVW